jgi:uncharacterized phiE125 gp8 family phage protein
MDSLQVITPPSFEPVTLAEAKLWLRLDDDDTEEDAMVLLLIKAMREYAEHLTGRALVSQTLELRLDSFPSGGGVIELPRPPLRSVSSISYVDSSSALQSLETSPQGWQEDLASEPGRVAPLTPSTGWPDTESETLGAVRIRYVAGYANPNAVPRSVRLWMQTRLATFNENREQIVVGSTVSVLPRPFVDGLLDSLRVRRMFG